MTCARAMRLASKYLAGGLGGRTRGEFENHLHCCLPCTRAFKSLKTLHLSVDPRIRERRRAPFELEHSIKVCVECIENPGRRVCPRLRYRLRLVNPGCEGVSLVGLESGSQE